MQHTVSTNNMIRTFLIYSKLSMKTKPSNHFCHIILKLALDGN